MDIENSLTLVINFLSAFSNQVSLWDTKFPYDWLRTYGQFHRALSLKPPDAQRDLLYMRDIRAG